MKSLLSGVLRFWLINICSYLRILNPASSNMRDQQLFVGHIILIFIDFNIENGKYCNIYLWMWWCIWYQTFILCGAVYFGWAMINVILSHMVSRRSMTWSHWSHHHIHASTMSAQVADGKTLDLIFGWN